MTALTKIKTLALVEQEHIEATFKLLGGNREKVAAALGIGTRTLYDKLKLYEKKRPRPVTPPSPVSMKLKPGGNITGIRHPGQRRELHQGDTLRVNRLLKDVPRLHVQIDDEALDLIAGRSRFNERNVEKIVKATRVSRQFWLNLEANYQGAN